MEVIASAYSNRRAEWRNGGAGMADGLRHDRSEPDADNVGRTWPGIVVADVDDDGEVEIVTAHSGGYVSVYNHEGT